MVSSRSILHVDMDAFFAAVEQRENPALKGKPVIVGADPLHGQGRGVVSACSYEARRSGIHSAMPIRQAWRLCPKGYFLRPNYQLYDSVSGQIMAILAQYTDLWEQISIDEAFLDVTNSRRLFGSPEDMARQIKTRIRQQENLTASIGIAGNKFLAKVASDYCKPDGLLEIPIGKGKEFLAPLPVSRMWGVGEQTEKRLLSKGWKTIGQLAALPAEILTSHFGKFGGDLWQLSNGIDPRPVCRHVETKSVGHEITYEADTADPKTWAATLLGLCEKVSTRLRQTGVSGRTVTLKVRLNDFSTFTHRRTMSFSFSTTEEIYPLVCRLLEEKVPNPVKIRLLGVYISHLEGNELAQRSLFDQEPRKWRALSRAVDQVRDRFGDASIRRATLLLRSPGRASTTKPTKQTT